MAQQGPRNPRSGRLSPRGDRQWGDDRYPDDDEELPPWAGLAVDPRWAEGSDRGKRRATVRPDTGRGAARRGTGAPGRVRRRPAGRGGAGQAQRTG